MEKLLEIAKKKADSVEIYFNSTQKSEITLENHEVSEINNGIRSGYCLRIIKDGCIGTAYTCNLNDRNGLVDNALASLRGGIRADFTFPDRYTPKRLNTYDSSVESLDLNGILDESKRVSSCLSGIIADKGIVNIYSGFGSYELRIRNSNGLDASERTSFYYLIPAPEFPKTTAGIMNYFMLTGFKRYPDEDLKTQAALFNRGVQEVSIPSGRMQVIFAPMSMYSLMWRIKSGTSAKSVYEKISPIANKVGEKIFSDKISIVDDPLDDSSYSARAFDDEGVETRRLTLIENGVLKGFFNNLEYAAKLGVSPTGNGYKEAMFGSESLSLKPVPGLAKEKILPGKESFAEMVSGMRKGVILFGCLGAHSGNIPNGDFSIGLSPGLYVENGEIVGRIKDGMIAGNIYDIMKNVSSVENKLHLSGQGYFPAVRFDDVMVSVK